MNQLATTTEVLALRGGAIHSFERQVSLESIIESGEPSVMKLKAEDYDKLFNYAVACATNYLQICYPNQLHLAPVIASDLIETRVTWRAADFINLFKFLRQRQDKEQLRVMGNTLTLPKFMELVSVYDGERADALQHHYATIKGEQAQQGKEMQELTQKVAKKLEAKNGKYKEGDKVMAEDFKRAQQERIESGKDVSSPIKNHQDFFEK